MRKGFKFDEVRIDLGKKEQLKPEYLALNPNGVVPTLVDDGVPIIESSVICEYLDEKYPQNPLVPSDLIERARMRAWTHYIEEVAVGAIRVPSFNRAFLYRFEKTGPDAVREQTKSARARCAVSCFSAWARRRAFPRTGDRPIARAAHRNLPPHGRRRSQGRSVADGRAIHACRRTGDAEHRPHGRSRTVARLGEASIPRVGEWYERLQARPAFQATYFPGSRVSDFLPLRPLYAAGRE